MADLRQGRQNRRYARENNNTNRGRNTERNTYVYGNTVLNQEILPVEEERPKRQLSKAARKNREKAIQMNLPYVIFLMGALCVSGYIIVNYLQLQHAITAGTEEAARMESQYLDLRTDNDETYTRIMNSVDLTEIERIAKDELGMHYATDGQVVVYTNEPSDYVKQFEDIDD